MNCTVSVYVQQYTYFFASNCIESLNDKKINKWK